MGVVMQTPSAIMTWRCMSASTSLVHTYTYTLKRFLPISIADKFALLEAKVDYTVKRLKTILILTTNYRSDNQNNNNNKNNHIFI